MIAVSLCYNDKLYYQLAQPGQSITYGSGKKDTVRIPDMAEAQLTVQVEEGQLQVSSRPPFRFQGEALHIGTPIRVDEASGTSLFASRASGPLKTRISLPHNGIVKIGRLEGNDLAIVLPFVSGKHMQLRIQDGSVRVEDLGSTHGTYLNGLRIRAASMHSGDVLNILTVRILLVNNELLLENVGTAAKLATDYLKKQEKKAQSIARDNKHLNFRLSPRLQDRLPQDTIVLDRPPRKGQEYHPSGSRIASMLSMGAMAGASLAMGAASPALAFARGISVAAGLYNMAAGSKMDKQRKAAMEEYNRRREEEYRTYIDAQRSRILAVAQEQRRILTEENPAPEECLKRMEILDRRIWERMSSDRDFLDVRLGMGYEDLCVPIKNYAENRGLMMEDDELEDLCNNIAEENRIVDYVPTRLHLRTTPTVGIIGHRDRAIHLVRNMIVSLTSQHSNNDLQIVGIFDNSERGRWASLRWLPHIWDSSRQYRYLAFDRNRAHNICEMLCDQLRRRKEQAQQDHGDKNPPPLPHYLVILGSREMTAMEPVMELLTANDPKLGVTTLFLYDEMYQLPRQCGCFIDLSEEYPSVYGRHNANQRAVFSRDPSVSAVQFSAFARRMAAITLEDNRLRSALPVSVTFLEGMGARRVEDLRVLERWKKNRTTETLAAPIGVLATGQPFCLDIRENAHGPHGLLAGTTGSGKSELLRTWILSMAVQYHPHEVNFVIIDYKGGGMANKLEKLPHLVGTVTNIDLNIARSLVSLQREKDRRMEIFKATPGVDNIDQYMELYYSGKVTAPMPRLIVVCDEFAELKKEEPEFMKELVSLARVGRSVGIHILLATQRPTGVVDDQIESNTRFRLCMKVNSVQDSKEMLKRPDAAAITQRGRSYIRVGEDEMFELFQSYWSGADYAADRQSRQQYSNQVSIVDVTGERIQPGSGSTKKTVVGSDQLTAIVSYIGEQAAQAGIKKLPGPWQPALPKVLDLQILRPEFAFDGKKWKKTAEPYRIPVGIYDKPALQMQGIQYLDFAQKPHYGIYGGPASGKTTLLKTMILSLALRLSPGDAQLCILDFGGRSLGVFRGLPHTAAVLHEDEGSKLEQLLAWLQATVSARKQIFARERVSNFTAYRRKKQDMPALFLVIDNYLRLTTLYEDVERYLIDLTTSGSDCGVHLVFTSNNINKVSMNLRTNVGGSIALHMTDRNDYRTAIEEYPAGSSLPVHPGRALIKDSSSAEFQAAMFRSQELEDQATARMEELVARMAGCWTAPAAPVFQEEVPLTPGDPSAAPVAPAPAAAGMPVFLPDKVSVQDMAPHYTQRSLLPLGLGHDSREPVYMDLREKCTLLVSGQSREACTEGAMTLGRLLLLHPENRLYILDGSGALKDLAPSASGYASGADMNGLVAALSAELTSRQSLREEKQWDADFDPQSFPLAWPQLCLLITDMHRVMEQLEEKWMNQLPRLCRCGHELGMIAIGAGCTEDILSYMYVEELTQLFVDDPELSDAGAQGENWQKGVCIGGKVNSHNYFQQKMLSPDSRSAQLPPEDAVVFDRGRAQRIRRIR